MAEASGESLLLDVWMVAGGRGDLATIVERVADRIGGEIPASAIVVRRLESERQRLDTVAVGAGQGGEVPPLVRTELTSAQLNALSGWEAGGPVVRREDDTLASLVIPSQSKGDALVAALLDEDRVLGFAIALASRGTFNREHEARWGELRAPLSAALRSEHQRQELVRYREALEADKQALLSRLGREEITEAIVGADGGLRGVVDRLGQVAGTDVPVLLLGETGTGKEVIARELHRRSPRASGPVVRVNCGAIPAGLIDSELFGHERGSFTGAIADRAGWFERADGGTLFLDEIGDLPADAQVRLLRVLQDGSFERVGGRRTITVDVRVVTATHRDLHAMVQEGSFREDLWYRISVFPIRLPPLRERPGDIPALVEHFGWRAGKRLGGTPLAPSAAELDLLIRYPWPGNIRELAAVIERAAILGGGHRLEIAAALGVTPAIVPRPDAIALNDPRPAGILTLDEATRLHIERALVASRGRIEGPSGAAAMLDINPHTLRSRMRRLGLQWRDFRRAVPIDGQ